MIEILRMYINNKKIEYETTVKFAHHIELSPFKGRTERYSAKKRREEKILSLTDLFHL